MYNQSSGGHGDMPKLSSQRILPREMHKQAPEDNEPELEKGWLSRVSSYLSFGQSTETTTESEPDNKSVQTTPESKPPAASGGQIPAAETKSQ
ncbi:uncharacterized protein N7529_009944 [Penicillium soppii]|uniref:uncharacterized protein n=1 Tax=Penicillium soppii TaxID=69789 RepID=UPI002549B610|nr:uncharacterized protein N7529_009944 [Penicillium soppii]KAJ5856000.1 hypothetical protein N7529_009944 [Penicillium soppii]